MKVRIYGERLRDARVVQSLLSKDVADRAGIAPSQLTRLERAAYTEVNEDTAERLAECLAFPLDFFSYEAVAYVKPGSTLFRARRTMPKREEEQLHTWLRLAGEMLMATTSKVKIPSLALPARMDFEDADSAAQATRRRFGLDEASPIPHLMRVMERNGIPIIALQIEADIAKHDAVSCWVGRTWGDLTEWPLTVVRVMDSWERTRFSVAHELGHLVLHRNGAPEDKQAEQEAFDFARSFMLPSGVLKELWPRAATLNSIMPIKAQYGMSLASIIEHAWRTGLIDEDRRLNFYKQLSNRKDPRTGLRWREQEPGHEDRDVERPRLVARMSEAVFGDGLRLSEMSAATGYWPAIYIRRVLASQIWSQKKAPTPTRSRADNVYKISERR
ncbi:XRE family transcriptional regulator [Micromonospora sp. WMMC273]|uniref:XRE family transcriptional regulator n=1 Tax=Micromonospora sp. WMMC273 TaxID=3015157 RepID=UPI0022B6DA2D|nr:XRE family transcriptional regulator [Micromonospora sp. WMMC273]MCZ7478372.1 XRE family transcriptional regulator [Micromonospora sp. WMMC273]